jgi:ABC-type transport system involved in multi-copper enzyme maturation permease subunit
MKTLFLVELQRLRARKLLKWLTVLVLLVPIGAGTLTFFHSSNDPAKVEAFEARQEAKMAGCIAGVNAGTWGDGEITPDALSDPKGFCEDEVWAEDPRFRYEEMDWILGTFAFPMAMLAWLIGASAIGAEWQSRGITTMLTWEPRRARVLLAKLLAAASVTFVWVISLMAVFAAFMYPAAALRGTMEGVDTAWWMEAGEQLLRIGAIAAIASMFGAALATIGRNTAAAFAVGFAYLTIVEGAVRGFKPGWDDWLIGDNLALFLFGPEDMTNLAHGQASAGLLVLTYALALVGIAFVMFRKREIA